MKPAARCRTCCRLIVIVLAMLLSWSCTFDYGFATETEDQPDILMYDAEYVRVREGDPVVRVEASRVERYDKTQIMELNSFSFEQFEDSGATVNAEGDAGFATVELSSGNVRLGGRVKLAVESEDLTIETDRLEWQDKERFLSGEENGPVDIYSSDGTSFKGWGFRADIRNKSWVFSGGVEGVYVHEDDDDENQNGIVRNFLTPEAD
jgi:LPS export ABC transporter protein LptC